MSKTRQNIYAMCLTAAAIALNIAGGQVALLLKLPIYLDCIGTVMIAAVLGPVWGMVPNVLSGLIMGITVDIYSLYFAPVGIIVGLMAGLVRNLYGKDVNRVSGKIVGKVLVSVVVITVPATLVCSVINALLFGGVTSSGSSVLVQFLSHMGVSLTVSIFAVQLLTDLLDRLVAVLVVRRILAVLPRLGNN